MTQRNACFDVNPQWGSHAPMLEAALDSLSADSLVIEHGAGMYSSPLIARRNLRVICIEEAQGWRSWAKWLYGDRVALLSRAKDAIPRLPDAALVFIDGAARERGDLLKWSLAAGVPTIVAHDTEADHARLYGYHRPLLHADGYTIEHDDHMPRTTTWRRP